MRENERVHRTADRDILAPQRLTPERARELAERAYLYGFAIVENYKAVYGMAVAEESPAYSGFNRYLHGRRLFDADYVTVVNANNDTLYSTAFADLRAEPLVITVPPTGDRYFTIQIVDMGTDNIAYLGTRTTGRDGGDYLLLGPSFAGDVPTSPSTGSSWPRASSSRWRRGPRSTDPRTSPE